MQLWNGTRFSKYSNVYTKPRLQHEKFAKTLKHSLNAHKTLMEDETYKKIERNSGELDALTG